MREKTPEDYAVRGYGIVRHPYNMCEEECVNSARVPCRGSESMFRQSAAPKARNISNQRDGGLNY